MVIAVMPYSWGGNGVSGVALAMHHRLTAPLIGSRPKEG